MQVCGFAVAGTNVCCIELPIWKRALLNVAHHVQNALLRVPTLHCHYFRARWKLLFFNSPRPSMYFQAFVPLLIFGGFGSLVCYLLMHFCCIDAVFVDFFNDKSFFCSWLMASLIASLLKMQDIDVKIKLSCKKHWTPQLPISQRI